MPSNVIPGFHYANARAAIDWLCEVFGFHRHAVYPGEGDQIHHAELTLNGKGMIMLGSTREGVPKATSSTSLIVDDADGVYARALAAGAKMIVAIEDKPFGGRGFACEDIEGNTWHVVTYNPWLQK